MPIMTLTSTAGPARFNMCGQALPASILSAPDAEPIRPGLAKRLASYMRQRIEGAGITPRDDWIVQVETLEAERPPSERSYLVRFVTHTGAEIGVQGIFTDNGWPTMDCGIFIQE
jgi:hypothetical protein